MDLINVVMDAVHVTNVRARLREHMGQTEHTQSDKKAPQLSLKAGGGSAWISRVAAPVRASARVRMALPECDPRRKYSTERAAELLARLRAGGETGGAGMGAGRSE